MTIITADLLASVVCRKQPTVKDPPWMSASGQSISASAGQAVPFRLPNCPALSPVVEAFGRFRFTC